MSVWKLPVYRHGVMDQRVNPATLDLGLKAGSVMHADDIEMEDVPPIFEYGQGLGRRVLQCSAVCLGYSSAALVPLFQVGQLRSEDRCLHLVQAAVDAVFAMAVTVGLPVVAPPAEPVGEQLVVRDD